jgi:hypothetical protein
MEDEFAAAAAILEYSGCNKFPEQERCGKCP